MSILIDASTRMIVQGITGKSGKYHAAQCHWYSPCVVGGVAPGHGGETAASFPVFDTVEEAKRATGCNATMIFVPPQHASEAILEAVYAEIPLIVCITEGIPVHDILVVHEQLRKTSSRLIGPNCPGIISPGYCKMGIMADYIFSKGGIGIVSRSGTLAYEAAWQLTTKGFGQSTCVGIGGDMIIGTSYIDIISLFEQDDGTEAVVLIGEIGGTAEEELADYLRDHCCKPLFASIVGTTAPHGRVIGHAGALITQGKGSAHDKIHALESAGVTIVPSLSKLGEAIWTKMKKERMLF